MNENPRHDNLESAANPAAKRRTTLAVLTGGGLFLAMMVLLAAIAIALGLITQDRAGRWQLGPWLVLETVGGLVAGFVAGSLARRMAKNYRGVVVLAASIFCLALLESTELLRQVAAGRVDAPRWLLAIAPLVAAAGVLLGGWRFGTSRQLIRKWIRTATRSDVARYSAPGLVLFAAALLAVFVAPRMAAGAEGLVFATALTLDLTIVAPGLVFALLVRSRRAPWIVIIPTFVVGYAVAFLTIPQPHRAILDLVRLLVIPVELTVIVYLVVLTRRTFARAPRGEGDFATRLRSVSRDVLASRIPADILTTEVSILFYAFRLRPLPPRGAASYTVHQKVGYLPVVMGLTVALLAETTGVHFMVVAWSNLAAWLLTGLSLYGCVWLVGDYRAMSARPIELTATHLRLRVGVRWETDIPLENIEDVALVNPTTSQRPSRTLALSLLGQPNFCLRLKSPVEVIGMYGLRRCGREIWLTVDGADRLCQALRREIG